MTRTCGVSSPMKRPSAGRLRFCHLQKQIVLLRYRMRFGSNRLGRCGERVWADLAATCSVGIAHRLRGGSHTKALEAPVPLEGNRLHGYECATLRERATCDVAIAAFAFCRAQIVPHRMPMDARARQICSEAAEGGEAAGKMPALQYNFHNLWYGDCCNHTVTLITGSP